MKSRPKGLIIKIIRSYYIWQKKKKKKRPTCIFQINYLHIFRFFVGMWTFPVCITARASEESISSEWHVVLLTRVYLFRPPTFKANSTRLIVFNFLASYATMYRRSNNRFYIMYIHVSKSIWKRSPSMSYQNFFIISF